MANPINQCNSSPLEPVKFVESLENSVHTTHKVINISQHRFSNPQIIICAERHRPKQANRPKYDPEADRTRNWKLIREKLHPEAVILVESSSAEEITKDHIQLKGLNVENYPNLTLSGWDDPEFCEKIKIIQSCDKAICQLFRSTSLTERAEAKALLLKQNYTIERVAKGMKRQLEDHLVKLITEYAYARTDNLLKLLTKYRNRPQIIILGGLDHFQVKEKISFITSKNLLEATKYFYEQLNENGLKYITFKPLKIKSKV